MIAGRIRGAMRCRSRLADAVKRTSKATQRAHCLRFGMPSSACISSSPSVRPVAMSPSASARVLWMPGPDSQNSVSWIDSHPSTPISTAAGVPFLVITTCSWVTDAASTNSLSLSRNFERRSICIAS